MTDFLEKGKFPDGVDEEDNFYSDSDSDLGDDNEVIEEAREEETAEEQKQEVLIKKVLTIEDDGEDDEVVVEKNSGTSSKKELMSQEERLHYFGDKVMSAILGGKDCSEYALERMITTFSPKMFRNENNILFSIYYNYRDRIKSINIDSEFIQLTLDINREIIEKSNYIDIHAYGEVDGSETVGYIAGVVKHFNRLRTMENFSVDDFNLTLEKYTTLFKSLEAQKVYAESNMILTEGLKVGNKHLVGFDDSFNYSRRKLAEIEGLVDMNKGTGFTSMSDVILNKNSSDTKKSVKIADFDIDELNQKYGGVYSGLFYEVMAPSKTGKSKFCARLNHTAIIKYKTNVSVWAAEGGNEAWTAQMRAIHFDYTYNEGMPLTERKVGVDQDTILHDKFKNNDYKELEVASSLDLASNPDYGKTDFIDRPFEVETFLDEIDASVKKNNSRLLIIDYLQLIDSAKGLSERERISKAYKTLLIYCKKNNVAVITPAQYKQSSIDEMSSKDETINADMRTAGGGSAEVFRTPDIIFAFWASTADIRNRQMKILSVPCRFNQPFDEIPCYMDLGVCKFVSLAS